MADLTITATSVVAGADAEKITGTAGASITAGQACYLDPTDDRFKLGDANGSGANIKTVRGTALHAAASGQPITLQRSGKIAIGATVTVGTIYVLSATPGGIAPSADLSSGHTVSIIGVGVSATEIQMQIMNSGVAVA
jgi:hypothetical protein